MNEHSVIYGDDLEDKIMQLKEVGVDGANWEIYYMDESTGEKWVKEYPHSYMNGGGAPQLRLLDRFPWE